MAGENETSTSEGRFFGIKTNIADMLRRSKDKGEEDKISVEVEDEEGNVSADMSAERETPQATPVEAKKDDKPAHKAKPEEDLSDEDLDDDDLDFRIAEQSERVQKRIKKLTWQAKEAERKAKAAEKLREEAINYARQVNQQNQQQAQVINQGEAVLVDRIRSAALLAANAAKAEYRQAYEDGDTDKIIEAQEKLNAALNEQLQAENYARDYQYRQQTAQQQAQQRPAPQAQTKTNVQAPSSQAQDWASRNPWFGSNRHRDMTAIAYATHERLVRDEGIRPDTDEYYAEIDAEMHKRFPEYFAKRSGSNQQKRPSTVVAPSERNNGAKPRSVRLKPSEVALAKKLGITLEQYAEQVLKQGGTR